MCVSGYKNLEKPTPEVRSFLGITFLLSTLIGAFGNVLMLIIIFKVFRSRRTVPNVLILALTITDLLTICLAFPPTLLSYFGDLDLAHASSCNFQATALNFLYLISVTLVAFMSLDRYLALSRPFFYKHYLVFDCKIIVISFVLCCGVAMVISLLPVIGVGKNVLQYPRTFCMFQLNARNDRGKIISYINVILLLACMLIVIVCNSTVSWTSFNMLRRSRQHRPSVVVEETGTNFTFCSTEECQFLKLSLVVMTSFVAFWILFLVRVLMIMNGFPFNSCWDILSTRLVTLHTVCNPWIYLLTRRQYRKALRHIVYKTVYYITCKKLCLAEQSLGSILGISAANVSQFHKDRQAVSKQTLLRSRSNSLKPKDQEDETQGKAQDWEMATVDRDL